MWQRTEIHVTIPQPDGGKENSRLKEKDGNVLNTLRGPSFQKISFGKPK